MKKVMLIGSYDKTDIILYLAKLISVDYRVLVADVTTQKKYKHVFPKVEDNPTTISQHDHFDIIENISEYSQIQAITNDNQYDIVLIDIDNLEAIKDWVDCDEYFLVTSFENPDIQNNLKLLESFFQGRQVSELVPITKVIYETTTIIKEDYLNDTFSNLPINWKETILYYPDERDLTEKINNQFSSTVNIKRLSGPYKNALKQMISLILNRTNKEINTLWKQAERRR